MDNVLNKAEYARQWRARNRERVRGYKRRYHAEHPVDPAARRDCHNRRVRAHCAMMRDIRTAQGCSGCGTHEGKLNHHHLDPMTKRYNVSRMCFYSWEKILDEIAKCTVLCESCHRKAHVSLVALFPTASVISLAEYRAVS